MSISMIFIHSPEMTPQNVVRKLIHGKNKHSHITCDISVNDFNHHFANISNKMNSKFPNFADNFFFWKGQKSIHSFRFKKMYNEDIKTYLGSLPNKSNNDILGMGLVFIENQRHILLYHWQMWKLNPLSRVSLSRTGRTPEWRLSIRMMATLLTKIIIVQYLS